MDNQLFPGGGAFLDDVAQGCPLCGVMFNNALAYQHHMQLHILSANAMLGNQPPPDPGISMPTPTSILDLIGGVSQHALSSGSGVPMVSQQAIYSGAAGSMPQHLISQGLIPGALPNMGLPQHPGIRPKEKKQKSQSLKSTSTSSNANAAPPLQRPSGPGAFKPRENSSSTYISTFPKDLQKMEHISHKPQNSQHSQSNKMPADVFPPTAPHIDPLEALILPSPIKTGPPGFERQLSKKSNTSTTDPGNIVNKESKKLFQPFVSVDTSVTAGYVTKSNTHFTPDSLLSPVKSVPVKPPHLDVLSTPQKISYHSNNENLFTSPPSLPNTSSGEIRHFGMFQDSEVASVPVERKSDFPHKVVQIDHDKHTSSKSQYFPDMDPLNISPKAGQSARKKDIESMIKMPIHQASLDHSQSSSPVPRPTLPGDFAPFRGEPARPLVSPKVSPAIPSGAMDSDSTSLSSKPHLISGGATEVLPTGNVPSSTPPVFGTTATNSTAGLAPMASPAIDIAVNPLGTGYFNALTQKFIDPTFNLAGDFNKAGSSSAAALDEQKQKIYFENGVIMNQDYDKISDTNDEDNLERLIEDIDTKNEPIIDKGYSEIEDLLNEFNEKQEDMKNKNQLDDFMKNDDFIKTVMEDSSKSKVDKVDKPETSVRVEESTFNPSEEFEMNKSVISVILEQEKERIEKESTELENARLSGLINTSTATSSSVTISSSSSTATSTVTSVSNTEPKVSSSVDTEGKKDDDHVDFEIPKVGKLMKIRKYFQIQEQKRKEQTEKVTEVRVHEKTEAPPVEDKPQTILVQVSKRKKIEYGPYLNRQSLLEGKPKANIETSPPKPYRPKPKPPLPEKRTFNLRERKTKTDFATLATKGSRTAETKKTDIKQKSNETTEKNTTVKEDGEEECEKEENDTKEEEKSRETVVTEGKIITRHQEKKKEMDLSEKKKEMDLSEKKKESVTIEKKKETEVQVEKSRAKGSKQSNKLSNESDKSNENETKQKDIKSSLRTRSARNDAENTESTPRTRNSRNEASENTEGKNLRKRSIKATAAGESSGSKVKVKKTEEIPAVVRTDNVTDAESVVEANTDSESKVSSDSGTKGITSSVTKVNTSLTKANTDSEEKLTRSKSKIKTTPEKSGIKKCSVNLGEKYKDIKTRSLFDKIDFKEGKTVFSIGKIWIEESANKMDTEDASKPSEKSELRIDEINKTDESNKAAMEETAKKMDVSNICVTTNKTEKSTTNKTEQFIDTKETVLTNKDEKKELDNADVKDGNKERNSAQQVVHKIGKRSGKSRHEKGSRKESNIFESIDHSKKLNLPDESQMVSITSTDNTDKKVTMKLKLGPNFQKAFKLFNPKKRKHEAVSQCEQSNEKEAKKEQKSNKETRKEQKAERELRKEVSVSKDNEKELNKSREVETDKDSKLEECTPKDDKVEERMEEKMEENISFPTEINEERHIQPEEVSQIEMDTKEEEKNLNETQDNQFFQNKTVKELNKEKKKKQVFETDTWESIIPEPSYVNESNIKEIETVENETVQNIRVNELMKSKSLEKVSKDNSQFEYKEKNRYESFGFGFEIDNIVPEKVQLPEMEKEINVNLDKICIKDFIETKETKVEKKVKHSVENEFQRLVNEAMAEAQKEGETAKSKNLRRRINENVKYNLDDSEDELDKIKLMHDGFSVNPKGRTTPKGSKAQGKGSKGKLKLEIMETLKQQQAKKEGDVYDFTDTEMSDSEESPKKLGFKPKYVSNLNLFGQKKLPFVSKPMSPVETLPSNENTEEVPDVLDKPVEKPEGDSEKADSENAESSISYVGKTVEPLKIKLTKIIPFKEKKHKHKKKKKKREKERKEDEMEKYDSESRDSFDSGQNKVMDDITVKISEPVNEPESNEMKKIEEVKSIDSIGQESNSNSNEGEDDQNESGFSNKLNKRTKLKEKKHICEYCNVGFGQKCDLRRHIMIHTGERPYPCQICDKRFQRKTDLNKHTRTHTGEKPYACEFCDKRVSDKSQLNVHRRLHTGDRPYCCSKCGKRCITSSELSRHKAVHCGEKVERCNLCKKAFTIKECLGMHMKLHYRSRGKLLRCEKCAIGFDKKIDLDNHHCVDPMKNVYVCSECYEEFGDEMLYAEHIKTHDLGVLACNVCTKIFEDKHSLETHLCSMGVDKQKQWACEICDTDFQDQDSLAQHMSAHDNDFGSFSCDYCSETFKVRKKLIEHARLHDPIIGPSVGNSPRNSGLPNTPSQSYDTGQSPADASLNDSRNSAPDQYTAIKREVDMTDFQMLSSGSESVSKGKSNSVNVKSELDNVIPGLPSNRSRASVISGTFRIDDESGDSRQSNVHERVNFPRSNFRSDSHVELPDKSDLHVNRTSLSARSPDFLEGDRFFEPADFTNSPDFSTLTESDDLDISPFDSVSNLLNQENEKSVKLNQNTSAKQIDSFASIDLKQKIMKRFGNNSQPYGTVPVSKTRASTSQGAMPQTSERNLPLQKSQISALLSKESSSSHSSEHSQGNGHGNLQRSASTDHTSQFQSSQNNKGHAAMYQQNSQNNRWSNMILNDEDLELENTIRIFREHYQYNQGLSKSAGNNASKSDSLKNDDIENQMKSEMFPDFDITPNKASIPPNNYGSKSAGSFPGVNPNAFSQRQFIQNYSEKSDFSSFGPAFMGNYPHSQNINSNSLKSSSNSEGQYSVDSNVTPDVNKRHLQGIYAGRSDILQKTPFYLSGVDDSMKDLAGNEKDETTALLSNFDQF